MSAALPALKAPREIFSWRKRWATRLGPAPFLPMSRAEMDELGWDACDVILVTGDAYVDHPSFGMAIVGRVLEAQGFRVGIIAQPDWRSPEAFRALGKPTVFFGITAGNMDSMVNRYTSDRRIRSDDAYTPGAEAGKRPDRSVIVYAQRVREAFADATIVLGGIEASLRRIAHFDYWSEKVRRSILLDARGDLLLYGNAERALIEVAHRLASGEPASAITDVRGTAFLRDGVPEGWIEIDSTSIDTPGPLAPPIDPYAMEPMTGAKPEAPTDPSKDPTTRGIVPSGNAVPVRFMPVRRAGDVKNADRASSVIRMPAYEQVLNDPVLYAHASRILHVEANPGNARALVQRHGDRDVWLNPPPIPLTTPEMDWVYELPYQRRPHPSYGDAKLPAYEMIRFSIAIQRGCFGGCTFCSITEHEGRIIQNRSEDSIIREIETVRDTVPGFTGVISDLGGPTANMWRIACKSREIESACRRPSCVFPGVCPNLNTDHSPLIKLYRRARTLPGIKKVLIASGVRYDLAIESPEYVKELAQHHVGGYLKIAPEAISEGPLSKMMKPGVGTYDAFKTMFDRYSRQAGKEQYLIPYFIAAHPGTTDEDMLELALWLKQHGFRADQVQAFLPSPMSTASAMYHSGRNPLRRITRDSETVYIPKGMRQRRLHKAFLRYHDAANWPTLREALRRMGRTDLIGNGKHQLIPTWQPAGSLDQPEGRRRPSGAAASASAAPATAGRPAAAAQPRSGPGSVVANERAGSRAPANSGAGARTPGKAGSKPGARTSSSPTQPFRTQHTGLPVVPARKPGSPVGRGRR
jgi:uncharacterized radical SAM protein YgiQ